MIRNKTKNDRMRAKRNTWTLFLQCGHLFRTVPSKGDLQPIERALEVQLSEADDGSCAYCATPNPDPARAPPDLLRERLVEAQSFRTYHENLLQDPGLKKEYRTIAKEDVVSWTMDIRYIEGIIQGALEQPLNNIISNNQYENHLGGWRQEVACIPRIMEIAVKEDVSANDMKKVEAYCKKTRHDLDCDLTFARGRLLGMQWANALGRSVLDTQLGPEPEVPEPTDEEPLLDLENESEGSRGRRRGPVLPLISPSYPSYFTRRRRRASSSMSRGLAIMAKKGERIIEESMLFS
ncbi:hypothetical protein BKA61DRAFT_689261 [Leptodontidium sp. MPI-SDFR-AT-0119]|nr:hypothetical protein BKA61DRAFT_689261 [Leptodontidium sp. MPI-SDFR-AT-0119]